MKNGLIYPAIFAFCIAFMFWLSDQISWSYSWPYKMFNYVMLCVLIIVFTALAIKGAVIYYRKAPRELWLLAAVLAGSLFVTFVIIQGHHGNEQQSMWMLGDAFDPAVAQDTMSEPKTYIGAPFTVIQKLGVELDSFDMIILARLTGAVLLTVIFYTGSMVFRDKFISILACIAFVGYYWARWNMVAFYYAIFSLVFTYLALYFLIRDRDIYDYILACMGVVIAAYIRYELAVVLGIAFLAYAGIFRSKKSYHKFTVILLVWLLFISSSLVYRWTTMSADINTQGIDYGTDRVSLLQVLANGAHVLQDNMVDFALPSHYISLFTFSGMAASLVLLIYMSYRYLLRKSIDNNQIYIFAAYVLAYSAFLVPFNIEGYQAAFKYSIQYFPSEIIVTFFGIQLLAKFIKNNEYRSYATYIAIAVFLVLTEMTTHAFAIDYHYEHINQEDPELDIMTSSVELDRSCIIAKVFAEQPEIDYYYGLEKNAVIFGKGPEFYLNLKKYNVSGKCIYFQFKEYPLPRYDARWNISEQRMDAILSGCQKTIILEPIWEEYPSRLVRYDC